MQELTLIPLDYTCLGLNHPRAWELTTIVISMQKLDNYYSKISSLHTRLAQDVNLDQYSVVTQESG